MVNESAEFLVGFLDEDKGGAEGGGGDDVSDAEDDDEANDDDSPPIGGAVGFGEAELLLLDVTLLNMAFVFGLVSLANQTLSIGVEAKLRIKCYFIFIFCLLRLVFAFKGLVYFNSFLLRFLLVFCLI